MKVTAFDERVTLTGNAGKNSFQRLPDEVIEKLPHLKGLAFNTSGIRLSFYTDSRKMGIFSRQSTIPTYSHMPRISMSGYDLYIDKKFVQYLCPSYGENEYTAELELNQKNEKILVDLYFPLYGDVEAFEMTLDDDCLLEPNTYSLYDKQIVFYGSSITQGGCASRNGLSYVNMLSTMLDTRVYNLGFSGNAKGEREMAEYISSLDMSLLVYDYDHNAGPAHLAMTHDPFFTLIRKKHPKLPVIFASRCDFEKDTLESTKNRRIIMQTYLEALNDGDQHVYFVDGREMFKDEEREMCTVDNCHPNTLGFYRMAKTFIKTIKQAMEESL
ncbi:MAG: hypothetical protein JXQ23_01400 [Clostridia bacterium]|nr:hypothetical protein [Clostridia bacterium]